MRIKVYPIVAILIFIIALNSCRKDKILTDPSAKLAFSQDTVLFDTVFTTVGTVTKRFRVYNRHKQTLIIDNINLAGGTSSEYRINVDGSPGVAFSNIELDAGDSLFIFVEATLDPNGINNPLIIEDLIYFKVNGNEQNVWLHAWGQDAYFHNREVITDDETWTNDKPHVIYGYAAVDSCKTLTIDAGATIYGHNNSLLYIYKGSLMANGSPGNEITFRADRLADFTLSNADSVAGQWYGIRFFEAKESIIEHAEVVNAIVGIQIDTLKSGNFVNLNKVKVNNSLFANILTQGANVKAENCLFGNAASHSGIVSIGGNQTFNHCSFGNFWSETDRTTPLFVLKDYFVVGNLAYPRPFLNAQFTNCIFYGPSTNDNEVSIDTLSRTNGIPAPVFNFDHCLFRTTNNISNGPYYNTCIKNNSPRFIDPLFWDFHIANNSAAKNNGVPTGVFDDIEGTTRDAISPSIGTYE